MSKDDYIEFEPGTIYELNTKENWVRLACCDCGLVHDIYIESLGNGKINFSLEVNEGETEKVRGNLTPRS